MAELISFEILRDLIVEINPSAKAWLEDSLTDLFGVGALDSLSVVELIPRLEERFGIQFDFADFSARNFKNLESLQKMLTETYGIASSKA